MWHKTVCVWTDLSKTGSWCLINVIWQVFSCFIIALQVISTIMYLLPLCGLLCLLNCQSISGESIKNYMRRRNDAEEKQRKSGTGGTVTLNTKERIVNELLMDLKLKELYYHKSNNDGRDFPPANHFLKVKEDIENSEVFKIIKMMPKGWFVYSLGRVSFLNVTSRNNGLWHRASLDRILSCWALTLSSHGLLICLRMDK